MEKQDRDMGPQTVADLMDEDDNTAGKRLVQAAAAFIIGVGLLFTGYLNFQLYGRAFTDDLKVLGLIPALLIEGSLAAFLVGGFTWFAHGTQGKISKIFGWAMFIIVALNTIVEFNTLTGNATDSDFIRLYAFWGVPLVVVVTIAFWKATWDADPSIQIMRQRRKIAQTLQVAKLNSLMVALGKEQSRAALTEFGNRSAEVINAQLRGNGHHADEADTVLAKDAVIEGEVSSPPKDRKSQ